MTVLQQLRIGTLRHRRPVRSLESTDHLTILCTRPPHRRESVSLRNGFESTAQVWGFGLPFDLKELKSALGIHTVP